MEDGLQVCVDPLDSQAEPGAAAERPCQCTPAPFSVALFFVVVVCFVFVFLLPLFFKCAS